MIIIDFLQSTSDEVKPSCRSLNRNATNYWKTELSKHVKRYKNFFFNYVHCTNCTAAPRCHEALSGSRSRLNCSVFSVQFSGPCSVEFFLFPFSRIYDPHRPESWVWTILGQPAEEHTFLWGQRAQRSSFVRFV